MPRSNGLTAIQVLSPPVPAAVVSPLFLSVPGPAGPYLSCLVDLQPIVQNGRECWVGNAFVQTSQAGLTSDSSPATGPRPQSLGPPTCGRSLSSSPIGLWVHILTYGRSDPGRDPVCRSPQGVTSELTGSGLLEKTDGQSHLTRDRKGVRVPVPRRGKYFQSSHVPSLRV